MGAGSSKASAAGESKDGGTERECRTYKVRPLENLCDGEDHVPCLTMQFGPEAVTFHTPEGVSGDAMPISAPRATGVSACCRCCIGLLRTTRS